MKLDKKYAVLQIQDDGVTHNVSSLTRWMKLAGS
jgi:hypothetical protein